MVDFKKALEKIQEERGYCNIQPILEASTFNATRTRLATTGKVEDVIIKYKVHIKDWGDEPCVLISLENGVTGYESWEAKMLIEWTSEEDLDKPFCACAGTPGRWDELIIHSTREVLEVARRWANFEVVR